MNTGSRTRAIVSLVAGIALAAAVSPVRAAWTSTDTQTLEPEADASLLKGACNRDSLVFVSAFRGSKTLSNLRPRIIKASVAPRTPIQLLWEGNSTHTNGLSNPVCDTSGVTFAVRDQGVELVRLAPDGKIATRKVLSNRDFNMVKLIAVGRQFLLFENSPDRAYVLTEAGEAREVKFPVAPSDEVVVDACALPGLPGYATLGMSVPKDGRPMELRLRKWNARHQLVDSKAFGGRFGGLACSHDGKDIQVLHHYADDATASFGWTRFAPGPNEAQTISVMPARITSLAMNGLQGSEATYWAVTNYKLPYLLEGGVGVAPKPVWRESSREWGATVTPPSLVQLDNGALVLVYEAVDRSKPDIPTVLRMTRLMKQ